MKQKNADGSVTVPSNHPRTRGGPDSRGPRIAIAQIGRSCSLNTGYVTFTDGSAYVYDPPSKDEFEALCASVQRGKQFNYLVRRATSGYMLGFTPPPDFEVIYSYPPYPGVAPAACPLPSHPWPDLEWATEFTFFDPSFSVIFTPTVGFSTSMQIEIVNGTTNLGGEGTATGTATYNGAGGTFHFDSVYTGGTTASPWAYNVTITQDGTEVLNVDYDGTAPFTSPESFTFADTSGMDSTIIVVISFNAGINFPSYDTVLVSTAS